MITFGLTGGIACGKSTVTRTFRKNNIPIVDADIVAREVVEPGKPAWLMVREVFGPDYFNADDTLNRIKLGEHVYADKSRLAVLTDIMSPIIHDEGHRQVNALHAAGNDIVGYDAALICEMGHARKFKPLIVVTCPQYMQVERLIRRNNLTFDAAIARVSAQMSSEAKVNLADFVIDTSDTIERSIRDTELLIKFFRWVESNR